MKLPNETDEYRKNRDELLKAEADLRERTEAVAALRRKLPRGGKVKEDYVFEERPGGTGAAKQTKLSELFEGGKNSLIVYSFMYGPEMPQACPMCTSILDGFNGQAPHVTQRANLAVVAKSPIDRIQEHAKSRGWNRLRLLSSAKNSYNTDYFAETPEGHQMPMCNVFTKTPEGVFHFWGTELFYAPSTTHPRHMDLMWPLWNFFDLTPEGRGTDWLPKLKY